MPRLLLFFAFVLSIPISAQPHIHWKGTPSTVQTQSARKQWDGGNSHWLLDFGHIPNASDWSRLRSEGLKVVSLAPDTGAIVYGPAMHRPRPFTLRRIQPLEKISPALREADTGWFLVEYHKDVSPFVARAIALQEHWLPHDNPYVAPNHQLVEGSPRNLRSLAEWDEVSYIFPASDDLIRGVPVYRCAEETESGTVGQSIPLIGDGWDGPGLGAASLFYSFVNQTAQLSPGQTAKVMADAFSQWSAAAAITFTQVPYPGGNQTIAIQFATGAHGDAYPFGPAGGVLAHTFYPYPVNPEPIAGDMHLNDANTWRIGADIDLFSVVLHETGHALGLGHSDLPAAVMYPYYRQVTGLSPEDIAAVQNLYAPGTGNPPAPGTGPQPPAANPPSPPANNPPKADPPSNPSTPVNPSTKDTTPPTLNIVNPVAATIYTSLGSIVLSGTASDDSGVAAVTWSSSIGVSGAASSTTPSGITPSGTTQAGITQWTTPAIPLYAGSNTIVIQASDTAGNTTWRAVFVRRQ